MPIQVTCPGCNAAYTLADRQAGKKVRCKKCEALIAVEGAAPADGIRAAPPRPEKPPSAAAPKANRPRRSRDDDEEEDAPPARKGGALVLWVVLGGVGAALLLLVACGGLGAFWLVGRAAPGRASPVASLPPTAAVNDGPVPPANPNVPPAPLAPAPINAPPAVAWEVQPDPLPAEWAAPDVKPASMPITGLFNHVLFPASPSPFVSVAGKAGAFDSREVWDLRTGQRTGVVSDNGFFTDPALSPDGAYLAARPAAAAGKPAVAVYTVADGQGNRLTVDDKLGTFIQGFDFAGPGQLLTVKPVVLESLFQIWDVKTGAEVRRFTAPLQWDRKHQAFSAGRRYLALFAMSTYRILIYDLTTGKQAGELAAPANSLCEGLAFSPDGKAFAGLFGTGTSATLRVWDLTTGKVRADHPFEKNPLYATANGGSYKGLTLEWLPDGSAWLLFGEFLVEAQSGATYWRIPFEGVGAEPRRYFGTGWMAYGKGAGPKTTALVVEALPADRLAAALQAARAGRDPNDTLPAAKGADRSAVKDLPAPAGAVDWKAKADALAVNAKLGDRTIPLSGKGADVVRVLFSRPDVGQAAVLSAVGQEALGDHKQVRVDRYDLAGGQHLGETDLFDAVFPKGRQLTLDADLSPDGLLLAVRDPQAGKRIDVWSLADGKHVVGWLPAEKDGDGQVKWFAFADAKRLLTLGAAKLTLWDAAECRAVYSTSFVRGAPALSPNRKYLAAFTGSNFEVLETATGERVGQLFRANARSVQAAAYRADGGEFAAVLGTDDGTVLARWDAATGVPKGEFAVAGGSPVGMEWCGTDHVLLDQTLIDLTLRLPMALCPGFAAGRQASLGPDGRLWSAAAPNAADPPLLAGRTLPNDATRQLAKEMAAGQVRTLLAPGMTVHVRVEGAGPDADADKFHANLANAESQRLRDLGIKTAADGPLTLLVQIQPARDTGQIIVYHPLTGGPRSDVHILQVDVQATLTDAQGGVLWTQKQSYTSSPALLHIETTETPQAAVNKGMWNGIAGLAGVLAPPAVLVRTAQGIVALPR